MASTSNAPGIGNFKNLVTVAQSAADRNDGLPDDAQAPLCARGIPPHPPKTTVPEHSGRPGRTSGSGERGRNRGAPSASGMYSPSRSRTWKCGFGLRADPKR